MSQLTKTIKMALKSTEEERAMLRARSAVQRFPVVEWRQRMEDFHKRSITASRTIAGPNAWRPLDAAFNPDAYRSQQEPSSWQPKYQAYPSQPDRDSRSIADSQIHSPNVLTPGTPGSPGRWSQETLTPGGDPHLAAPRLLTRRRRGSVSTTSRTSIVRVRCDRTSATSWTEQTAQSLATRRLSPIRSWTLTLHRRGLSMLTLLCPLSSHCLHVDEKQNSPLNNAIASVRIVAHIFSSCVADFLHTSLMPTEEWLPSSCRTCSCSTLTTRRTSFPLRSTR